MDNNLAFEIPLNNVSHTTTAKNEVTLEFHQNDDAAVSLIELRFHIPTDQNNPENDTVQVGTEIFFNYCVYFYLAIFTALYGSHSQSKNGLYFPNFMYFSTYFPDFFDIFSQM